MGGFQGAPKFPEIVCKIVYRGICIFSGERGIISIRYSKESDSKHFLKITVNLHYIFSTALGKHFPRRFGGCQFITPTMPGLSILIFQSAMDFIVLTKG